MRTYQLLVIPGDGIGPEITAAALDVLHEVARRSGAFSLGVTRQEAGAAYFRAHGVAAPSDLLARCREANAVLKGPAGLPDVRAADGTEAGLLGGILRPGLDAYAGLRPIKLWPGVRGPLRLRPGEIDYLIVRENTEGLYFSRGRGVVEGSEARDTMRMTRTGVERVVRRAFEFARRRSGAPIDHAKRVTCVDKANVLRSFAFFRRIFDEVAAEHPDIEAEHLHADAAASAFVMDPGRFDVLVMENFLGDILSDLGAGTVGGLGMCPSANVGDEHAYFEPIHGSAPSIAGRGVANPLGQVLASAMLLDHIGERAAARQLELAVWSALESGQLIIDQAGCPVGGTNAALEAVLERI